MMDSGASHHVTNDLHNLSLYSDYRGPDEILVGDGSSLHISHIGSTKLITSQKPLALSNVLHVPNMQRNLISVSKLCQTNHTSVEFFPNHFLVKDLATGAPLVKGHNINNMYELPTPCQFSSSAASNKSPFVLLSVKTTADVWHRRLGHPSSRILNFMLRSFSLAYDHSNQKLDCNSCLSNKSHKLPFYNSSLSSSKPLELLYTDVWGSPWIQSNDGFHYYVLFVDHFSKFTWLFPIRNKFDVVHIFSTFKAQVEKQFNTQILSIYFDNGGEYHTLSSLLATYGIKHLNTPPHTPEHNGVSERKHRHIVEIGLTLLHQAFVPKSYWSHAFQTTTYLINRMPTPNLQYQSPYEILFQTTPNYSKLKTFDCLCYPWLKPYNNSKLQSKSRPCVFLGYSTNQSAYKCLDISTNKMFISRHVKFVESSFPFVFFTLNDHLSQPKNDLISPIYITDKITKVLPCSSTLDTSVTSIVPSSVITDAPTLNPSPGNDSHPSVTPSNTNSHTHLPFPTIRTHPMVTRS